jgi:WD40 repeat protein
MNDVKFLTFSNNMHYLITSDGSTCIIWSMKTFKHKIICGCGYTAVTIAPNDKEFAISTNFGQIMIWDIVKFNVRYILKNPGSTTSLSYSSDSEFITSINNDGSIKIWNIKDDCVKFNDSEKFDDSKKIDDSKKHFRIKDDVSHINYWSSLPLMVTGTETGIIAIFDTYRKSDINAIKVDGTILILTSLYQVIFRDVDNMIKYRYLIGDNDDDIIFDINNNITLCAASPDNKMIIFYDNYGNFTIKDMVHGNVSIGLTMDNANVIALSNSHIPNQELVNYLRKHDNSSDSHIPNRELINCLRKHDNSSDSLDVKSGLSLVLLHLKSLIDGNTRKS